jgi:hypothetical protein
MSTIKKTGTPGAPTTPPTPTTAEPKPSQVQEQAKAQSAQGAADRSALIPDENVQKWFLSKGQNTATIQGQIRKGLENLLQSYYSVKQQGALSLQAQEMMARSGQIQGSFLDQLGKKKKLAPFLRKKAKAIAAAFGITEEEAAEFVALLAVSFGMKSSVLFSE